MANLFRLEQLSVAWKLALSAIGGLVLFLCAAAGFVGHRIWQDASDRGTETLQDSTLAMSDLLDVYDETARKASGKDMAQFKKRFGPAFSLTDGVASDGKTEPQLRNQDRLLNGDFDLVDDFTQATGAVATVFGRTADDFRRITTSLKSEDGKRVVGTLLDRKHPAYQAMLAGKPFKGMALLFGKSYSTYYEPIVQDGRTVGILFVGTDLTDVVQAVHKTMQSRRPFGAGVVYAVNVRPGPLFGQVFGLSGAAKIDADSADAAGFVKRLREVSLPGQAPGVGQSSSFDTDWSPRSTTTKSAAPARVVFANNANWAWVVVGEAPLGAVMADARRQLVLLGAANLVALLVLLVMVIWLAQRLVGQPLGQLARSLTRLADNDLSQAIMVVPRGDEIGRITGSMEGFRHQLVATLSNVRGNAESVAAATSQIASGNQDLSRRTEAQANALQQTAAAMEQLGSTLRHNADNATQANELAVTARGVATRGVSFVGQVVETMKGIDASSKKIAEITSVIDAIAFQTNILALNAAVEAARAGDQGRGFAVVAAEVRLLAKRSADAAKEIKALIEDSVRQVSRGASLVDRAGETMSEIVGSIQRVSDIVAEISLASGQQTSGVDQVGVAVMQMDQATQQNAALVERSASAAESLTTQATGLVRAVAVFQLDRSEVASALVD